MIKMRNVTEILQDIKYLSDYHMPQGDYDRIESFCNEITKYINSLEKQNVQINFELNKLRDKKQKIINNLEEERNACIREREKKISVSHYECATHYEMGIYYAISLIKNEGGDKNEN